MKQDDWTTRFIAQWSNWLGDLRAKPNIHGLEIGVHQGRSSVWFCREILTGQDSQLDAIDPWPSRPQDEAIFDAAVAGLPVRKLKGYSDSVLPQLKAEQRKYHFVYVDGCHYAGSVLFDIVLRWSMLVRGGILIADDYRRTRRDQPYPARLAIDAWLSCMRGELAGYEISKTGQLAAWRR